MNVSVYAGGVLAYDSRLPVEKGYTMQSIYLREKLNTGGSATLVLPPLHPLREGFPAFKTLVEIYRDNVLRWRGRALPETRDFYCRGTITCEGELCFLQDAILRPGTYAGDLAAVFALYMAAYNSTVEPWKRFAVGNITVTAPDALNIVKKSAEKIFKAVMELVTTYGGYIIFDSSPDGSRRINWYKEMPYSCNQRIMLGYNLTDYSSSVDVSGFATRIVPYGAADENGIPVTIDVDGKDYVENVEAVAQRGIIEATVSYPDISDPAELRDAAQRDVDKAATLPEIIKLSALDMSRQDLSQEAFRIGQRIEAESVPHKLSGHYDLLSLEEDLVNPGVGGISLMREATYADSVSNGTLTGAVSSQGKQDPAKQLSSFLTAAGKLTSAILGADGGCIRVLDTNGDGMPDELYVADDPDIAKAVNVWRLNYMGLAASSNGYNGPYELGMALGVGMLASFLKVGVITSTDGTVKIDLTNNKVTVETLVEGTPGRLELSSAGIAGYGWDYEQEGFVKTLSIEPGYQRENGAGFTTIRSDKSTAGIAIAPSKEGTLLQLGQPLAEVALLGSIIQIKGKTISWEDNGDGTFSLIGR